MFSLQNLSKKIGKQEILKKVNLTLSAGETFGFLGPNGAGKTTLVKIILDLMQPTSGTVELDCEKTRIGYLPEYPYFYEYLTGEELLIFTGKLFNLSEKEIQNKISEFSQKLNLSEQDLKRKIKDYSKGMKQRLGFMQALINDPDLIFLDEPFSGLDPLGRKIIRELIFELKQNGKTIFFNSHILSDIEQICDRVGIIHKGEILAVENVSKILKENKGLEEFFIQQINLKNED